MIPIHKISGQCVRKRSFISLDEFDHHKLLDFSPWLKTHRAPARPFPLKVPSRTV